MEEEEEEEGEGEGGVRSSPERNFFVCVECVTRVKEFERKGGAQ